MKKSAQGIVRRTRGRGTTSGNITTYGAYLGNVNANPLTRGGDVDRLRWRTRAAIINSGKAANDEATQAWRVTA